MPRLSIDEARVLTDGHAHGYQGGASGRRASGQYRRRSLSQPQSPSSIAPTSPLDLPPFPSQPEKVALPSPTTTQHERQTFSTPPTSPLHPPGVAGLTALPTPNAGTPDDPPSIDSSSTTFPDGPPDLEYTVRTKKRIIFLCCFWTLVVVDSIGFPVGLYFGLTYGLEKKANGEPRLTPNAVFSIVTAAIGGVSIIEYFLRSWRLWKKSSTCRVIGAEGRKWNRWWFDWFHVVFTSTWLVLMVELIVGSTPKLPPIRLVAMPPSSLLFCFGVDMAVRELFRYKGWRYPIRISSQPKGAVLLPAIYPFIEDIVAADGGGGTAYRERLARRYHASHVFRSMLERMTNFWIVGALGMATLTTILIFTLEADWGYAVGWSAPFVWAIIWSGLTWWYVEHMLKVERRTWNQEKPEA